MTSAAATRSRTPAARRTASRLAAWLPAAGGLLVILACGVLMFGTFWGDPTIYLAYSQNVAGGDVFRFNPGGEFSSGVASPLWELVLAIPLVLGGAEEAAKAWALLVTVGAFAIVFQFARSVVGSTLAAGLACLFLVGELTLYGVLMYDTALTVAVITLSLLAGDRVVRRWRAHGALEARAMLPLAAAWAALPITRIDTAALVAVQAVALWITAGSKTRRDGAVIAASLAVAALPSLLYYGYSQVELGSYTVSNDARSIDQKVAAEHLGGILYSGEALRYFVGIFPIFLLAGAGLWLLWKRDDRRWLALCGAAAIPLYAALLVFYPVTFYMERYFLPAAPFLVVGTARALVACQRRTVAAVAALALASIFLAASAASAVNHALDERDRGYDFDEIVETDVVSRLNAIAEPGDTVLAYEVQDRYTLRPDLRLLSLNGLTDGEVADYRSPDRMLAFLQRYQPEYWIANDAVHRLPYTRSGPLDDVVRRLMRTPGMQTVEAGGVRFDVVERRTRPLPAGFAGWRMLLRLSYEDPAGG